MCYNALALKAITVSHKHVLKVKLDYFIWEISAIYSLLILVVVLNSDFKVEKQMQMDKEFLSCSRRISEYEEFLIFYREYMF